MSESHDTQTLRELARSLDCFIEQDLQELGEVKDSTLEAWRKRGTGPAYILFGNRYLYPRAAVSEFLQKQVRERREPQSKGIL